MKDQATALRERIIAARTAANLSQNELAQSLGVQPTAISKIETGVRGVSSTELASIAQACGRSLSWFFSTVDQAAPTISLRASGPSSEVLRDVAWANEFAEAYAFLKKALA